MLVALIAGPKSMTGDHFDIFIEPLIEELLDLWEYGVYCADVERYKELLHFVFNAMVIKVVILDGRGIQAVAMSRDKRVFNRTNQTHLRDKL